MMSNKDQPTGFFYVNGSYESLNEVENNILINAKYASCKLPNEHPEDTSLIENSKYYLGNSNSFSEEEIFETVTATVKLDASQLIESNEFAAFIKNWKPEDRTNFSLHKFKNGQFLLKGTFNALLHIKNLLKQILILKLNKMKATPQTIEPKRKFDQTEQQSNTLPSITLIRNFDTDIQNTFDKLHYPEFSPESIHQISSDDLSIINEKNSCLSSQLNLEKSDNIKATVLQTSKRKVSSAIFQKQFTCKVCHIRVDTKKQLQLHQRKTHSSKFFCPQCSYSTSIKPHFLRHVKSVHENERPFTCEICQCSFKRADALSQHEFVHLNDSSNRQPKVKKGFKCHTCKKVFRSAAYLREHTLTHSDERSFLCEICGASFKTRAVQRGHMSTIHSKRQKPFCSECGKYFFSKFSLTRHMILHARSNNHIDTLPNYVKTEKYSEVLPPIEIKSEFIDDKIRPSSTQPSTSAADSITNLLPMNLSIGDGDSLKSEFNISKFIDVPLINSSDDKLFATHTTTSDSFSMSFDDQIPYVIESSTEITNEVVL